MNKSSGRTKWAVGCGFSLIISVLVLGGIASFGIKMTGCAGVKKLSEIVEMDGEIVNQSAFTPPDDGMLSLEQVGTLVYIQTEIKESFRPDYKVLILEYGHLVGELEALNDNEKSERLDSLSGKLMIPLHRARKAQIAAINLKGICLQEYEWLKAQARLAFDLPAHQFNLKNILQKMENDASPEELKCVAPVSNPQNRELLENHQELLTETHLLSAIGL